MWRGRLGGCCCVGCYKGGCKEYGMENEGWGGCMIRVTALRGAGVYKPIYSLLLFVQCVSSMSCSLPISNSNFSECFFHSPSAINKSDQ